MPNTTRTGKPAHGGLTATLLAGLCFAAIVAVAPAVAQQLPQSGQQPLDPKNPPQKAQQKPPQPQPQAKPQANPPPNRPPQQAAPVVRPPAPPIQAPTRVFVPPVPPPVQAAIPKPSVPPPAAPSKVFSAPVGIPAAPVRAVAPPPPAVAPPVKSVLTPPAGPSPVRVAPVTPPPVPAKSILTPPVAPKIVAPAPAPGAPPFIAKAVQRPAGPATIAQVKDARVTKTDAIGRSVIVEPGNRTIVKQDNRVFVTRNETTVIQTIHPGAKTVVRPGGIAETVYVRPDGVRVISEVDGSGRLVRRYGQGPGGREIVYVDNRKFYRNVAIGVGIAAVGIGVALALSPPVVALPRERYIVDYDRASDDDVYSALSAPPVMALERDYSLDEIRYNRLLRDRMPRIDLDTVTFESGAFYVSEDQYPRLERVARGIRRALENNPGEMFLIEGHTDATGTREDNLSLSDRRAEAVARVLSEYFGIPSENLVTQGYGEENLKIETQGAERANRRVAVRRITPLLGRG